LVPPVSWMARPSPDRPGLDIANLLSHDTASAAALLSINLGLSPAQVGSFHPIGVRILLAALRCVRQTPPGWIRSPETDPPPPWHRLNEDVERDTEPPSHLGRFHEAEGWSWPLDPDARGRSRGPCGVGAGAVRRDASHRPRRRGLRRWDAALQPGRETGGSWSSTRTRCDWNPASCSSCLRSALFTSAPCPSPGRSGRAPPRRRDGPRRGVPSDR
jgi:hypothetical protein